MALELDMTKSTQTLKLSLQKKGILQPPTCEVAFDLDVSGSYRDEHEDGITNMLLARLVPWGLLLDPDQQLDVFTFSDNEGAAYHLQSPATVDNYSDYVRKYVIGQVPGWRGGTVYAPVLRANLETFGWISGEAAPAKRGLFGFGRQQPAAAPAAPAQRRKSLVLFNTDGDTQDKSETKALFKEMQDRAYGMYVQFIGVSNQGPSTFHFIQDLADEFDNCGLTVVTNVRNWVQLPDEQISEQLISDEMIEWFKA